MQLAFRLPYQRLTWQSPLALDEARSALEQQMADVPFFKNPGGKAFRGRVQRERFRCSRVIHYRNLFLPVARGRLLRDANGTRVELVLHTPLLSTLFLAIWTFGILAVLVGGVLAGRADAKGAQFWFLTLPLLIAWNRDRRDRVWPRRPSKPSACLEAVLLRVSGA